MKDKERYFRVRYGFGKADQVTIPESDLEKALYAWNTEQPVQLGNSFINGKHITVIEPNFHKHTGWNHDYQPTSGADFAQIKRDSPCYDGVMQKYKNRVAHMVRTKQQHLIGTGADLPELIRIESHE